MSQSTKKPVKLIQLFILIATLIPLIVSGQVARKVISAADVVELPEVGALIIGDADGPRIMDIAPASARLEAYRSVDLQASDVVVSANGSRTEKIADLAAVLEKLSPGDTLRLAVQRQGRFAVAAIVIGTEEVRDAARAAIDEYMDAHPDESGGGPGRQVVRMTMGGDDMPWIDLGVMIEDTDGGLKVVEQIGMPLLTKEQVQLETDDIILALDDRDVASVDELTAIYDEYAVGDKVTVSVMREGERLEISFTKPELPGTVKVMKR